jgi:hypothetical protein
MRHTLAGPVVRANNPGWFWAAGTNTARPVVSGGLGTRPSGFLLEAPSMTHLPAFRTAATAGASLAGGTR